MGEKILVTGAAGQIGSELVPALRERYEKDNVIAALYNKMPKTNVRPFEIADSRNRRSMEEVIKKHGITTIYHLVGIVSAAAEKNPELGWETNFSTLKIILDLARDYKLKVFWPSSIAAFGPTTPKEMTPQHTLTEPTTIYGISKVAGELLCQYYHQRYGVDVRSVRYPGIISWKTAPGGGTTDYAVAIFSEGLAKKSYTSFVSKEMRLPMMYMDDAIRATIQLMEAPPEKITVRTSYNLAAVSFSAEELAREVAKRIEGFRINYAPDSRQKIAESWPHSIDDSAARKDWGWAHQFDLPRICDAMIDGLKGE